MTTIQETIRDLDRIAGPTGRSVIKMQTGTVVLDRSDPEHWRLAIGIFGAWPSLDECAEIAGLIGVPNDIKRTFRIKRNFGQQHGFHVVEYLWTCEGAPVQSPPAIQPPLDLDLAPIRPIEAPDDAPIEERFHQFHAANPQVYRALRSLALPLAHAGRKRIGVKMLWETLRYSYSIVTDGSDYKLDNSYTSRYARLLMDQEPELRGLIETRVLRA